MSQCFRRPHRTSSRQLHCVRTTGHELVRNANVSSRLRTAQIHDLRANVEQTGCLGVARCFGVARQRYRTGLRQHPPPPLPTTPTSSSFAASVSIAQSPIETCRPALMSSLPSSTNYKDSGCPGQRSARVIWEDWEASEEFQPAQSADPPDEARQRLALIGTHHNVRE